MTERLKKAIIRLIIDEVAIDGEKLNISATIPFPNKIHEREIVKSDFPDTFNAGATLGPINETNMTRIWNKHKQINTTLKPKIFVAMSGGVDSSVAAFLLKQKGHNVTGVYIKSWNRGCAWKEDKRDAARVCAKLNIPFLTFDFTKEYEKEVVDYMTREYMEGKTPNPDVMCNKKIKFGAFLNITLKMGADYVATGHYIKIKSQKSKVKSQNYGKIYKLYQAKDKNKDQSYFLWTLTQEQLKHCLFPVGDYLKPEIREIARKAKLITADKKESQGLCFVGKVKFSDFLKNLINKKTKNYKHKAGNIINIKGEILGKHSGLEFYTLGQRRGIKIGGRKIEEEKETPPLYVVQKDYKKNALVVGEINNPSLYKKELNIQNLNWINPAANETDLNYKIRAKIRYRAAREKCVILLAPHSRRIKILFEKPQRAAAPGQSVVFYKGEEMLGGGVISN